MAQPQLTATEMEASLHVWLDTEFTFFKVEQLAAELAPLARDEQDFILGWIRRIASTHITLACPKCGQTVETTLNDLRATPLVTCGACGQEFPGDVELLVDADNEQVAFPLYGG